MLNKYYPVNDYHTPADRKRALGDKLSLGTSIYFKLKFIQLLLYNRKLANSGNYDTRQWALSSYQIQQYCEDCGAKFHITGLDNVDKVKDEPVVFISNHMGTLETMVFPSLVAPVKEVTFVVKQSLVENKLFGPIMRARKPITVGREDSRQDLMKVLNEGKQKLSERTSVIIFPQGTRSVEFKPENFNSLGIKLAQKAGVRVIPMAIKTDFWGNGKLIKDLGSVNRKEQVHIKFGEPMEIKGTGKAEHQFCVDFIQKHLTEWNKQ